MSTRQHSDQRPIPKDKVMEQRGDDMERCQNHQRVGENFVDILDRMSQRAVCGPWRRHMEKAEDGYGSPARKL